MTATPTPPRWHDSAEGLRVLARVRAINVEMATGATADIPAGVDIVELRAEVNALERHLPEVAAAAYADDTIESEYERKQKELLAKRALLERVIASRATIARRREAIDQLSRVRQLNYRESVEVPYFRERLQELLPPYLEALRRAAELAEGISELVIECDRRGVPHAGCLYPGLGFGNGPFETYLNRIERFFGIKVRRGKPAPAAVRAAGLAESDTYIRARRDHDAAAEPERRQIMRGLDSIARFALGRLLGRTSGEGG